MLTTKFIAKYLLPSAFVLSVAMSFSADAKEIRPITHKLWQNLNPQSFDLLKKVNIDLDNKNYDLALNHASAIKIHHLETETDKRPDLYDATTNIILWKKYSDHINPYSTSFSDISRFVMDNPFYPNITDLRRNVERVIVANQIPYKLTEQYFKLYPPLATETKIYLVKSQADFFSHVKLNEEEKEKARSNLKRSISELWEKENFSYEEEKSFLEKYHSQLGELDHFNRVKRLLFEGKNAEAKRLLYLVDADGQKLFEAAMELQKSPKHDIDHILLSVPRKLRADDLLSYRRILWYREKGKEDDLIDLMSDLPKDSKFSDKWWSLRRLYGREMIKQKKYKIAYQIISGHNLPETSQDFWEAEWTAGWIALRFLDLPKTAYKHFDNLYRNVSQSVSLARAAYWLGMTSHELGDKSAAINWYKTAAKYPTFFYGQLAIHKHRSLDELAAQQDIILPADPEITERDLHNISQLKAAQVAYVLNLLGEKKSSSKVFEWLVLNAPTDGQIAAVMRIVNEIADRELDAKISRIAAKRNVVFIKDKFQIVEEVADDEYAPLVHAIIKQESGFAPTALSHVGAIGFMQLMPATAKLVAKDLKVPYNKQKLASDIKYNVLLGSFYIKKLIERFDGSEMLAIASYNAGPNATQRWINEFYDPRKEKDIDKVVDWIELITYSETRNYVQRIMENLIVYKYLMSRSNYDNIQ